MTGGLPRAIPLASAWRKHLPLDSTGWAEAIAPGWLDAGSGTKTMLCQSRLAYVFLHAGALGEEECARSGLEGMRRLDAFFWSGRDRGWLRSIDDEGRPADPIIDTYDQAFGLLASAWAFRITGLREFRERAVEALGGLDEAAKRTAIAGYPEWRESEGGVPEAALELRRQNPHMHLFEAFLAWHEIDPEGPWLAAAAKIFALLDDRFTATDEGGLAERLDRELRPLAGRNGRLREPGHHCEWVWLLRRWEEAGGRPSGRELSDRLWALAVENGTDGDGRVFELVDSLEGLVSGIKLLWPQTERLKALCARLETRKDRETAMSARRCLRGLELYFEGNGPMMWVNRLERERLPIREPALSRLLYHLFIALVEYERVMGPPLDPKPSPQPNASQGAMT